MGATQNQNESFNSTIWLRCPKTEFCSLKSVEAAVGIAVLTFNHGATGLRSLLDSLGSSVQGYTDKFLQDLDSRRVRKSQLAAEDIAQRQRKYLRSVNVSVEESRIEQEGLTYESGGFT